jgi:hypothetical protein
VERRVVVEATGIDIGAVGQQNLSNLRVPVVRCLVKRRPSSRKSEKEKKRKEKKRKRVRMEEWRKT